MGAVGVKHRFLNDVVNQEFVKFYSTHKMKSADISPCKNVSFFCILKAPRSFFLVKMSYYSQRHVTYSNEILPSGHLVRK